MTKLERVLIMAGGTGGHVFPGLAVAKRLRSEGIAVDWLGTQKGLESKLVPEAGLPIHYISISGIRGKGLKDLMLAPFRVVHAVWQAYRKVNELKPDVVIGMGGFVSGPGGIASWLLGYPLVIHEQNAKPGTTNKWLAHVAKKVLEGFPDTFKERTNVLTVGNPVREEIAKLDGQTGKDGQPRQLNLLVVGGSLGAQAINHLVPESLAKIPAEIRPNVYHQSGDKHFENTLAAYQQAGIKAQVVPFIKEMDKAYAWADIVLCRAGALTVSELCAAGVGAILVPFPFAIDDHQTANANVMAKQNAAVLVQQSELTNEKLTEILMKFIQFPERCQEMAKAAHQLRKADATEQVLAVCKSLSGRKA